jgi:CTP synthase (UTP-ammonia lyase)
MTRLAVLGDHDESVTTHRDLDATLALLPAGVTATWVPTDSAAARNLDGVSGVWVAPGTPYCDEEAVLEAITFARTRGVPLLGTCGGFQHVLLEFAREVAGLPDAAHGETDPNTAEPLIEPLACALVGETRTVVPVRGTRLAAICGEEPFPGFHWCRFGLSPGYVQRLVRAGLVVSAHARDAGVEGVELPSHPFFVATLFQPQAGSGTWRRLHPLVAAFAGAARRTAPPRTVSPPPA